MSSLCRLRPAAQVSGKGGKRLVVPKPDKEELYLLQAGTAFETVVNYD